MEIGVFIPIGNNGKFHLMDSNSYKLLRIGNPPPFTPETDNEKVANSFII
jgi:hypothetical protein